MTTRRLLLITYVFPPFGGIPVQRALNFARYLPGHGIEVHVLTAWNAAAPVRDESLLSRVPSAVKVHRVFTPEPPFYLRKKIWDCWQAGAEALRPPPMPWPGLRLLVAAASNRPSWGASRNSSLPTLKSSGHRLPSQRLHG